MACFNSAVHGFGWGWPALEPVHCSQASEATLAASIKYHQHPHKGGFSFQPSREVNRDKCQIFPMAQLESDFQACLKWLHLLWKWNLSNLLSNFNSLV